MGSAVGALVAEPVHGRALVEGAGEAPQSGPIEAAPGAAQPLRGQGLLTAAAPSLLPAEHRCLRDPQTPCELCDRHTYRGAFLSE